MPAARVLDAHRDCSGSGARVRYDKTTDGISDRSSHKYGGYLTPLLPIAAASPDCQPRPLSTPKITLTFTTRQPKIQLKILQIKQTWQGHPISQRDISEGAVEGGTVENI